MSKRKERCVHYRAVQVGVIEGALMSDETWLYETPYRCPDCGRRFTEMHRTKAALSTREEIRAELHAMWPSLPFAKGPKPAA